MAKKGAFMNYRTYYEEEETMEFKISQYEDLHSIRYTTNIELPARYIEQDEVDYRGNLLIEALPPSYTDEQIYEYLENAISISDNEKFKNATSRIHALMRLKNIFQIWDKHLVLANKIDVVIRRGYTSHQEHTPVKIREAFKKADDMGDGYNEKSNVIELRLNRVMPQMPGFTIFGTSGGGKTVAIENVLSLYPQVILHENYKGKRIIFKQLVWLKIDCTYNGSIGGICEKFFNAVDDTLGTPYSKSNKSENVSHMITNMAKIASLHKLGCLIIDEIQHVVNAKVGVEAVMNFLVTLQNEMRLPIVLIGTYKAVDGVLTKDYRQARRASGIGEIEWGRMENDRQYRDFLENIWRYQWLQNPSELNDDMVDTFYSFTMGNIDRTVKLFQLCQLNAISLGIETITSELVDAVSEELPLTNKIIKAIRTCDYKELAKYDDIFSGAMDNLIENKIELLQAEEQLRMIKLTEKQSELRKEKNMSLELMSFAQVMGVTEKKSKELIDYVLVGANKEMKMSELKKLMASYITGAIPVPTKVNAKMEKMEVPSAEELRAGTSF
jgi:hypothetical protein